MLISNLAAENLQFTTMHLHQHWLLATEQLQKMWKVLPFERESPDSKFA